LTATLFIWRNIDEEIIKRGEIRFTNRIEEITQQVISRLQDNETILLGGRALFDVHGDTLTRKEWQTYAASLQLGTTNPGILGFGYSAWLPADKAPALIRAIQTEGFPDFSIHPPGNRPQYTAIIWLEPFNKMNQRAFGYDMYSEPVRRAAMEHARDTGKTSLTNKVVLLQEMEAIPQNGVLMYIPTYRAPLPTDTVHQRRTALRGFVYSPIRMNDLIFAALKKLPAGIDFSIHAGSKISPDNLLFSSIQAEHRPSTANHDAQYTVSKSLDIYGTTWLFSFASLAEFDREYNHTQSRDLLLAGILISLGLGWLTYVQGRSRRQALIIADQMREQLVAQQKFAHHIQQSPLAAIEWDMQGIITAWNPAAQVIFGYASSEALGRHISILLPEKKLEQWEEFSAATPTNKSTNVHLTPDGRVIDCEWYTTTLLDDNGGPLGMVALVQDVTERNRTEQALRQERNLLQNVMDGAKNSHLVFLDRDFNFVRVNQTYAETCGYTPQEMIGKNHFALYPNAENEAIFVRVRDTGEPFEVQDKPFEFPDQPERGLTWWNWSLSPVRDGSGDVSGLVFSLYEITQRKQLEMALQASETQFRLLFEEHSAIMLLVDPSNGQIVKANKTAAEFYGYSLEQLQSMTIFQINQLPRDNIFKILNQVSTGTLNDFAVPHQLADGTIRMVEVHTAAIPFEKKLVIFAIIHDITDRVEAEKERQRLETKNTQLQKTESLSRMAGAIAHHFNNKLQAVMMSMEMVREIVTEPLATTASQQIEKLVTSALDAAGAAAEVSRLLLIYLGSAPCKFTLLDLVVVCRKYQPVLLASVPECIEFRTESMPLGLMINSNANNLQQILTNLVTNAWEALPNRQGKVSLSIYAASAADIQPENRFPSDFKPMTQRYACLEVSDNGIGIKKPDIDRLFDPFFSNKFTGRGMGLPTVLGLIRAHKGVITVNSREGQGSTFRVYFPLVRLGEEQETRKLQVASREPTGGTILVVEDEIVTRRMVSEMLKRLGYTVLEAEDGLQGLEMFNQHRESIRCILSDIVMPRMNGWEMIAAIREQSPEIPIILCSGYNEAQMMEHELSDQPHAFLEKPFLFSKLKEALTSIEQTT
jgi:PAS domain S-box-containing protein